MNRAPHVALSHTLAALADPTRRAILRHLSSGEARVTSLARPFAISLNAVSKHIRVLERARLVRRSGRKHILSFNPRPLDEAATWIEAQRTFWTARLDALDELFKAEDLAAANNSPAKGIARRKNHPGRKGHKGRKGKNA
jgi:DNA-binding transcriptional ArsR family regulator